MYQNSQVNDKPDIVHIALRYLAAKLHRGCITYIFLAHNEVYYSASTTKLEQSVKLPTEYSVYFVYFALYSI